MNSKYKRSRNEKIIDMRTIYTLKEGGMTYIDISILLNAVKTKERGVETTISPRTVSADYKEYIANRYFYDTYDLN